MVDAASLAVVGWLRSFTISHESTASSENWCGQPKRNGPILAILTDSPDFNLRIATKLKRLRNTRSYI